jgi:manganese transport protein
VGVISLSYLIEIILVKPDWSQVVYHAVVPQFAGPESVLLAAGILGATVMPHVIFLHSSLTQKRIVVRSPAKLRKLFRFEVIDVLIAMGLAGLINAAMLMMAASTFYREGITTVATIQEAHKTLEPLLGKASSVFFALSLLASGLSSSSVGTMAGQVIMQGFLRREIPVWIRRLATMIPSLIVILIGLDPTRTLVISQVVLSFGLPFAVIPLVIFTSRRKLMKVLVNSKGTTILACLVTVLIVCLNIYLLVQIFSRN